MAAITRKMVEGQFAQFCKHVPAPEGQQWALEYNAPGGGKAYYKLGTAKAGTQMHFITSNGPLGLRSWIGAKAAFDGLHNMWRMAEYLSGRKS